MLANSAKPCQHLPKPTRNINLTDHQDRFVADAMASGQYQNASEVVRDGLRLLEQRAEEDAARLARLPVALAEAEDALGQDFEDVGVGALDGWLGRLGAEAR